MEPELKRTFACSKCWGIFNNMKMLNKHVKHAKNKQCLNQISNKCEECKKYFKTEDKLKTHIGSWHKPSSCRVCGKVCPNKKTLSEHILCHKTLVCSSCLVVFKDIVLLNRHVDKNRCARLRPNKCEDCEKRFSTEDKLIIHKNNCNKTHVCPTCGKICSNKRRLTGHMVIHNDERSHICHHCNSAFKRSGELTLHLKFHSGIKDFSCELCDEWFVTSGNLLVHKVTHTDARPFQCNVCHMAFKLMPTLKNHTKIHQERVRNHACNYCQKLFYDNTNMKLHEKTHSKENPHTCPVCEKLFAQISYLKTHLDRCHYDEGDVMAFKCVICKKGYPKQYLLNRHMKCNKVKSPTSSKDINAHECDNCNKSFKKKYALIKHRQGEHGVLPLAQVQKSL